MNKVIKQYAEKENRLFGNLQSLLISCGIKKDTIADAIEKSLGEIESDGSSVYPWLLPLIFWKIFDSSGFILTTTKTPAGNEIPLDVQAAAYAIWSEAQKKAVTCGLDELDAVQALTRVVHALTDRRARGDSTKISNLQRYMFAGYLEALRVYAEKVGIVCPVNPSMEEPESDDGVFFETLDNDILYSEIVIGLSAKEMDAVICRYFMGCTFREMATMMGLSGCVAARQAHSRAIRKIRKTCRQKRLTGHEGITKKHIRKSGDI